MGKIAPGPAANQQTDKMLALANQLEDKLKILDEVGAHIAAAHLDSAIARIRSDARAG